MLGDVYERVTSRLPGGIAGRIDLFIDRVRPSLRDQWAGGALNGQERRRETVRENAGAAKFDRVLETGTFQGASSGFLADVFGVPVRTVESNRRYFVYGRARLKDRRDVTVVHGDSRAFLTQQAANARSCSVFVYLDAHWKADLPLTEELTIVADWPRCVVMVDDFQVPGDDGYTYDNYGPGRALVEDYLPVDLLSGWTLLYPAGPSDSETGRKRGCCVLASPPLAEPVRVPSLRVARVL